MRQSLVGFLTLMLLSTATITGVSYDGGYQEFMIAA